MPFFFLRTILMKRLCISAFGEIIMSQKIKDKIFELSLLIKNIPPLTLTIFVLAVFSMNLLAGKSISLPFDWLALDCGILISWVAFLIMDVLTNHFGPRAATGISIVAILINLTVSLLFAAVGAVDGVWAAAIGDSAAEINIALNTTIGGTWYIILGSTVAFIGASGVNNFTNFAVGLLFKKNRNSMGVFIIRSYVSSAMGQFTDNLIFALLVSHFFFGWTILQCITCAITGMGIELLCQIIFSLFGYRTSVAWKKSRVGEEYIAYTKKQKEHNR